MKSIIFRTNGGPGIGYGHFFRCYSLAKAFNSFCRDVQVMFIINKDLEGQLLHSEFKYLISNSFNDDIRVIENLRPQLFILDSYLADNSYLIKMKKITKIMIFDDNNDIYDSTIPHILLNGNIHAEELGYRRSNNTLYLLGTKYLVMREDYWEQTNLNYQKKDKVLVTTGGTDQYNISYSVLINLAELPYEKSVIIGPGYKQDLINKLEEIKDEQTELIYRPLSLQKYIREAKVVVAAGGSTVYEVLSQKSIPIIFSMADNQDIASRYFEEKGVLFIGKYPKVKYNTISEKVVAIIEGSKSLKDDIFKLIDGQGVKRIIESIDQFID